MADDLKQPEDDQDRTGGAFDDIGAIVGPTASAIPKPPLTDTHVSEAPRKRKKWLHDPPMFWVTLAGVIAVVAYTSVAALQASLTRRQVMDAEASAREAHSDAQDALRAAASEAADALASANSGSAAALVKATQANKIANDTARRQLRAYMSYTNPHTLRTVTSLDITILITNTGNTPTIGATQASTYRFLPESTSDPWDEGDIRRNENRISYGPRRSDTAQVAEIAYSEIAKHRSDALFIFGRARYRDVFPGSPVHITEFCYEVLQDIRPDGIATKYLSCRNRARNCADSECTKG